MLKFTYVIFLAVAALLLFVFSKDKTKTACTTETNGSVTLISDSTDSFLGVITENNILLRPTSMGEEVVLAAGQKVTICYKVDSSSLPAKPNSFIPVHIETIEYQP